MTTNMKPADELKTIRDQIKALQAREAELRDGLIAGEMDLVGNFAIASVTRQTRKTLDRKAAEAELGSLAKFEKPTEVTVVKVEDRIFDPEP